VFLTAISIRIGLFSSKIHNGDDTPKNSSIFVGTSRERSKFPNIKTALHLEFHITEIY